MGGRLDSTNVITPELSIITNIGHDHQKFLGDTLAEIAAEKAGIIKAGVPVVIGEKHLETESVFRAKATATATATDLATATATATDLATATATATEGAEATASASATATDGKAPGAPIYFAEDMDIEVPESDLKGPYQEKNLRTVMAALEVYRKLQGSLEVSDEHITAGLLRVQESTGLRGRWQVISEDPKVIIDGGHNKEAIRYIVDRMQAETEGTMHFVLGFVNDKDLSKIIPLFPTEQAQYYFTQADVPRAMPAKDLVKQFREYGLEGEVYPTVKEAVAGAVAVAKLRGGEVFMGGSMFTVGEV